MIDFTNMKEVKKLYEEKLQQYPMQDFYATDEAWNYWKGRIKAANFSLNTWASTEKQSKNTKAHKYGYCLPNFLRQNAYPFPRFKMRKAFIYMSGQTYKKGKKLEIERKEAQTIFKTEIKPRLTELVNTTDYQEACQRMDNRWSTRFDEILARLLVLLYPTRFLYMFDLPYVGEFEKQYQGSGTFHKNNKLLEFVASKLKLHPVLLTRQQVWAISQLLIDLYNEQHPKASSAESEEDILLEEEEQMNEKYPQNSPYFMTSYPLNLVLYGPPGTGKTYHSIIKALEIVAQKDKETQTAVSEYHKKQGIRERQNYYQQKLVPLFNKFKQAGQIRFITFHQNYSYEDFVESIRPMLDEAEADMSYQLKDGIFKEIANEALLSHIDLGKGEEAFTLKKQGENTAEKNTSVGATPNNKKRMLESFYEGGASLRRECKPYVLIIDEINRGNISKIFGELITLIETDKRIGTDKLSFTTQLPYTREQFGVPDNLYIIGTMNTADKSIALVDVALRRRFEFEEMKPMEALIEDPAVREIFCQLNSQIEDEDHKIGHSYFINKKMADLPHLWEHAILPLIKEYFYGDDEKIKECALDKIMEKIESLHANNTATGAHQ